MQITSEIEDFSDQYGFSPRYHGGQHAELVSMDQPEVFR